MTCASCVSRVEKQLQGRQGVQNASVNLATERVRVQYLDVVVTPAELYESVKNAGNTPVSLSERKADDSDATSEKDKLKKDVIFAAAFAIPLMLVAMQRMVPGIRSAMESILPPRGWQIIELVLTIPIQFWAGRMFYTHEIGRAHV